MKAKTTIATIFFKVFPLLTEIRKSAIFLRLNPEQVKHFVGQEWDRFWLGIATQNTWGVGRFSRHR
jgi:hypothetical protein